jgi:arginyl-tRNA--protein-N-Asp/Glu arginylyltransferase
MIKNVHFPFELSSSLLDQYLSKGWYRIGQVVFTTDYIPHPHGWHRVFWLRYQLPGLSFQKKHQEIMRRNKIFRTRVTPFALTEEMEDLYALYKSSVDFNASPTMKNFLFDYGIVDDPSHNVYDSHLVEVRDGRKLIALGVFDKGKNSLAGILNFYHPEYRKYSLGKWLMLLKVEYALKQRMKYYYPGYIAVDYEKFDYKLFLSPALAEIYDPVTGDWLEYSRELVERLKDDPPNPY